MTEPAPWIFDAAVTTSLLSLTLKKHVKMHAPTAKSTTDTIIAMLIPADTGRKRLKIAGKAKRNKMPSVSIHILNGIRTGLAGFPRALMDIRVML